MNKYKFKVEGGIGDILLAYSSIRKFIELYGKDNLTCILASHFKHAEDLIKPFDIETSFYYYKANDELIDLHNNVFRQLNNDPDYIGDSSIFEKDFYPEIDIPIKYIKEAEQIVLNKHDMLNTSFNIIGIHPFGSKFSNNFLTNVRKVPPKDIPLETLIPIIKTLASKLDNTIVFVIFGSFEERNYFNALEYNLKNINLIPVFDYNIWTSFALIDRYCQLILAADSAIKSFSLIKQVPTVVTVGDYQDQPRDENFIKPYENNNKFKFIRFQNKIIESQQEEIVNFLLENMINAQ